MKMPRYDINSVFFNTLTKLVFLQRELAEWTFFSLLKTKQHKFNEFLTLFC